MVKFREYLDGLSDNERLITEMSIAGYGDWTPSGEMIITLSTFILKKNWKFVDKLKIKDFEYDIYKQNDEYILGNIITSSEGETTFEVDLKINLREHKSIAHSLKIQKRLMNVDGVKVKETMIGFGLASAMYEFLVSSENIVLLGDEIQYFGARKLWAKLSKNLKLIVDIVDIDKGVYLERDVKIYHGLEDYQFDERIWDYSDNKKYIRLILKDIKN